jgi:1-acyl-sn-glycerol-3-phosphate acyltransferase
LKGPDLLARIGRARFPLGAPTWPDSIERPAPKRRTGLDFDNEWSRRYPVRLLRAMVLDNVARPLAAAAIPTTSIGLEELRTHKGPFIFAANHASHVDTPLLLTALPVEFRHRTVVAAASDFFFDRTWKAAIWSFALGAIPIDRSRVNRRSADAAAELLEDDWNLIIFPEGGRSPDGWTHPFRGGAAYLSRRTGAPVVPVYIDGTRNVLGKSPTRPGRPPGGSGTEDRRGGAFRRSPVTILFGRPLSPAEGEDARRFGARIESSVALLGHEAASDWWTARRQQAEGTAPDPAGPVAAPWRRSWALGPGPGQALGGGAKPWPPR